MKKHKSVDIDTIADIRKYGKIKINNIIIGDKYPPAIIVELGINHSGNLDKAIHLVDIAKKNGANIIKHQTHIPNEEMSSSAKNIIPGNAKESIFDVINKNCLSLDKEKKLAEYIRKKKYDIYCKLHSVLLRWID